MRDWEILRGLDELAKAAGIVPECKHGMISDWCAICQKNKLPEESSTPTFAGLLKGLK